MAINSNIFFKIIRIIICFEFALTSLGFCGHCCDDSVNTDTCSHELYSEHAFCGLESDDNQDCQAMCSSADHNNQSGIKRCSCLGGYIAEHCTLLQLNFTFPSEPCVLYFDQPESIQIHNIFHPPRLS